MACCLGFFGMRYITTTAILKAMGKEIFPCPKQIKLAWRVPKRACLEQPLAGLLSDKGVLVLGAIEFHAPPSPGLKGELHHSSP